MYEFYVTEEVALTYASEECSIQTIKKAHDSHIHMQNNVLYECEGCPHCKICRCPVPIVEHESVYGSK